MQLTGGDYRGLQRAGAQYAGPGIQPSDSAVLHCIGCGSRLPPKLFAGLDFQTSAPVPRATPPGSDSQLVA